MAGYISPLYPYLARPDISLSESGSSIISGDCLEKHYGLGLFPLPKNAGILMRIIWPPRRSYNLRHICDHLNCLNGQIQDECKWNAGGILNLIKYAIKLIVDLYLFIYLFISLQ